MRSFLLILAGMSLTACATQPPRDAHIQTAHGPEASRCLNAARTAPHAPVQQSNWHHLSEPSLMSAQWTLSRTEVAAREQNELYRKCMARAAG